MKTLNRKTIQARSIHALESAREDLRANILVRRAMLQLSQADLAERSGVSRPVLSKIETASGDFQISALAKLAAALDCPVSELLLPTSVRSIDDAEIAQRFQTPRAKFIKGKDLWAAVEEAKTARESTRTETLDRSIPSGGRQRSRATVVNGRSKTKR
jgi:transcriptional regulator with XRE-family HTH domain